MAVCRVKNDRFSALLSVYFAPSIHHLTHFVPGGVAGVCSSPSTVHMGRRQGIHPGQAASPLQFISRSPLIKPSSRSNTGIIGTAR